MPARRAGATDAGVLSLRAHPVSWLAEEPAVWFDIAEPDLPPHDQDWTLRYAVYCERMRRFARRMSIDLLVEVRCDHAGAWPRGRIEVTACDVPRAREQEVRWHLDDETRGEFGAGMFRDIFVRCLS